MIIFTATDFKYCVDRKIIRNICILRSSSSSPSLPPPPLPPLHPPKLNLCFGPSKGFPHLCLKGCHGSLAVDTPHLVGSCLKSAVGPAEGKPQGRESKEP